MSASETFREVIKQISSSIGVITEQKPSHTTANENPKFTLPTLKWESLRGKKKKVSGFFKYLPVFNFTENHAFGPTVPATFSLPPAIYIASFLNSEFPDRVWCSKLVNHKN